MTYNQPPQYGYGAPGGQQKQKRTNSGFIVPNDAKRTPNDPDLRGSYVIGEDVAQFIMQGGRDLWVSAWHKQAKNPKTGLMGPLTSISLQAKQPRAQGGYNAAPPQMQQQPQPQYGAPPTTPGGWLQPPAPQPPQYAAAGGYAAATQQPTQQPQGPQQMQWQGGGDTIPF